MAKRRPKLLIGALEAEYKAMAPLALRFGDELVHQLERLLADRDIALALPIQRRVKEWVSIAEKLDRKALTLSSISELQDLVGLRTILQFRRDIERVCEAVEQHFTILERYDTAHRLKEDQFGYSSIHFVLALPDAWLAVPTLSSMKGLVAELQVRTTAQHIWAAASHTLQYKQESSVPIPVRRAIHRVSALLETVDLEFERVLQERDTYRQGLSHASTTELLNVDLIEQVLGELLPKENKEEGAEPFAALLEELTQLGIRTSGELQKVLTEHRDAALAYDAEIANRFQNGETVGGYRRAEDERIARGVYFTHVGLTRRALREVYGEKYQSVRATLRARKSSEQGK